MLTKAEFIEAAKVRAVQEPSLGSSWAMNRFLNQLRHIQQHATEEQVQEFQRKLAEKGHTLQ